MLDYSDLTVVKNADGMPTALGYTINSLLAQNNMPLFGGSATVSVNNKKERQSDNDYRQLAIPAGLVCRTETSCTLPYAPMLGENDMESETIPEGLYEKLLSLAETKPLKKLSRHKQRKGSKDKKNKTHKHSKQ